MINFLLGILANMIIATITYSLIRQVFAGWQYIKLLHSIPCSHCKYFTNSHYLKCTVCPHLAGSELAINCREFAGQNHYYSSKSSIS